MKGMYIVLIALLHNGLLKAAAEPIQRVAVSAECGYAETIGVSESLAKLESTLTSALAASLTVAKNLTDLQERKTTYPWLFVFESLLKDWELQLENRHNSALSIQLLLCKMKNQVKEMGTATPCLDVVEMESSNVNTVIQSFLQNLIEANSLLVYLMQEVEDIKEKAQEGQRTTWRVGRWYNQLEKQKPGLFKLLLGYYRLKEDVRQVSSMLGGRGRSLSCPFS